MRAKMLMRFIFPCSDFRAMRSLFFFFQAEDGIRDGRVTGVQTCALPISLDVIAPYEVLGAGGVVTDGALEVELVSAEGAREVPSGIGPLSLRATARLEPRRADLI